MGEDPLYFATNEFDALRRARAAPSRTATGLPVMISPGQCLGRGARRACAPPAPTGTRCYQETHAPGALRAAARGPGLRRARRGAQRRRGAPACWSRTACCSASARRSPTARSTVAAMRDEPVDQVRVMTFVPQRGTPLEHECAGRRRLGELVTIAAMRLVMPDRLIPASLDVDGIAGLEPRLAAGRQRRHLASCRPTVGLAGVSQSELDIDDGLRTAAECVAAPRARWGCGRAGAARVRAWAGRRRAAPRAPSPDERHEAADRRRQAAGHRGRLPGRRGRLRGRADRSPARGARRPAWPTSATSST